MWAVELYDRVEERTEKIFYFQHKENAEKKVEELKERKCKISHRWAVYISEFFFEDV